MKVGGGGRGGGRKDRAAGARPSPFPRVVAGLLLLLVLAGLVIAFRSGRGAWTTLEREVRAFGWDLSLPYLALALASGVAALLASAGLWAALFRSAGGRTGPREAMAAWLGSNLGRYLPGKVWQLTSLAAYVRARGDSGAAAIGVSLALQAAVLAVGAAVAAAFLGGRAFGGASPLTLAIAVVAIGLALHPAVLRRIVGWSGRLLREEPREGEPGLDSRRLLGAAGWALVLWALHGVGFWALVRGLASAVPLSLTDATGVFAAGYVLGYLVLIAPGGIVVREGAIAGLLTAVSGLPLGPAGAVAVAARLWTTTAELAAFGLAAGTGLRDRAASR